MRTVTRVGDIYKVTIDNGEVRFFQLIARDHCALNGDVIRIFSNHYYLDQSPSMEELVNNSIERYMHTYVINGLKMGYWEKYGTSKEVGSLNLYFRSSLDRFYPRQNIVSKRWDIWKLNDHRIYVGELPKECARYEIGTVFAPLAVMIQLTTGNYQEPCYPLY